MKNPLVDKSINAIMLTVAVQMATPALAESTDLLITKWVIAGGGEVQAVSSNGVWRMSGTIGEWSATDSARLSGGSWQLTGGFWGANVLELVDSLFRDRFEEQEADASDQRTP